LNQIYGYSKNDRPIVGSIKFNLDMELNTTKGDVMEYGNLLLTTLHEIGHVLAFSNASYPLFIDPLTGKKLQEATM